MKSKIEYKPVEVTQLESEAFALEPLSLHHSEELYQAFQDKSLYQYIDRSPPGSLESMETTISRVIRGAPLDLDQEWFTWVGRNKKDQSLIGWFEASNTKEGTLLAYTVFAPNQGKGFAVSVTRTIIEHFLAHYRTKRFILEIDSRNRISVKVAERLGFTWHKTVDKACMLHGYESHEFVFFLQP